MEPVTVCVLLCAVALLFLWMGKSIAAPVIIHQEFITGAGECPMVASAMMNGSAGEMPLPEDDDRLYPDRPLHDDYDNENPYQK